MSDKNYSERVEKAKEYVTKSHEGQFRKDGKTPFITHPLEVARLVQKYMCTDNERENDILLISALARDCVEDIEDFVGCGSGLGTSVFVGCGNSSFFGCSGSC